MSRSAVFFKRLASASTELHWLQEVVKADKVRAKDLVTHKAELGRVYDLIEASARRGAIRVFLPKTDPVWNNTFVQEELCRQGFAVAPNYHSSQGAIEWWESNQREGLEGNRRFPQWWHAKEKDLE